MALRVKNRPAVPGLDQLDVFWNEFREVEESRPANHSEEDHEDKEPPGEQEVEWLKEAGFDELVKKYRDSKEIDPEDDDVKQIASSLTRKQAEAVRKRINTLNDTTKRKLDDSISPQPQQTSKHNHADVRTIFPVQTSGQPSNANAGPGTETNSDIHSRPVVNSVTNGNSKTTQDSSASPRTNTNAVSPPGAKIHMPHNGVGFSRPGISRRTMSEGVALLKTDGNSDIIGNLGIAGTYSPIADMNGDHQPREGSRDKPGAVHPLVDRRGSEDIRLHGVNKHQHGPLFCVTGLSKQELFNAAEKTKESIVDEVEDSRLKFKDLSIPTPSTPDTERETIHESPVDVSNPSPPKIQVNEESSKLKKYTLPQFTRLPNYTLTKDELGVTSISDFSKQDMEKVRSLALIELTALFDSHSISLHRRKPIKRKVKESGVFGVPLPYMLSHDRTRGYQAKMPIFLQEIISFLHRTGLKEEGLLRIPGSTTRIKALKEDIEETFNDGAFCWEGQRVHDVVSILKQFLRELPFPLLTYEYQPTFASVESIPERRQQLQALNLLILLLPSVHRDCLRILLQFLKQVISHEKQNRMNLNNVAMIMAPNLFLFKSQNGFDEIKMAQGTVNIVRMLIKYQNILWTIPGFMVMQVRYLYEAEGNKRIKDAKAVRKLLLKRSKEAAANSPQKKYSITDSTPVDLLEADIANNIIRVKAPMLNKFAMAIQLMKGMTAGDIVDKFKQRPEAGSSAKSYRQDMSQEYQNCVNPHNMNKFAHDSHFLFEMGGNIGERRLDHDTNIIALYKVNPHAEWVIKPMEINKDN